MTTMIRKVVYPILLALCLSTGGCSDFLERSAQNLVIPTTCADYTEILQGEGYFYNLLKIYESDKLRKRKLLVEHTRAVE